MGKKTNNAAENIKVLVRCRPLNEKEKAQGFKSCVELDLTEHTVSVQSNIGEGDRWTFDAVINNTFTQQDVFVQFIMPLVDSVLDGFNATVFAYGQSGSGKTHTMVGKLGDENLQGLTPRSFKHVFERIDAFKQSEPNKTFSLYVSFIEIYNGKVQDLLAKQQVPLALKENKDKAFFVQGANIPQVKSVDDIIRQMEEGTERRRVACTDLNADSSRSHSVFSLIVECTEKSDDGDSRSVTSKLNLVDLAGSERQTKTGALGETLKEGCNINLSLSALGTVIDTIVKGKGHVPFRSSPLTMLLKDSLGGASKTIMFANINPSEHNFSETVSTLRFADRAKQIKNKPVVNLDTKDQKIVELTELVNELREKLKRYETEGTGSLEEEVERLRERVGELEVNLDNAIKGREVDGVDFENARAKLNMERESTIARITELEEQIVQLQNDLQIAETSVNDERMNREEMLRICSAYLRGEDDSKPITTVNELEALLRDRAHGKHSAEMSGMHNELQMLKVNLKQMTEEREAERKELEEKLEEANTTIKSMEHKWKKAETKLGTARRQSHASGLGECSTSDKEVAELRAALENAQKQLEGAGALSSVEAKLQELQKNQNETAQVCLAQLQQVKEALGHPGENDSVIVQQLKAILMEDNNVYNTTARYIDQMHSVTNDLVSAVREAQVVPLAAVNGDITVSENALKKIEAVDAKKAGVYADMLSNLHSAVDKAHSRRNELLSVLSGSSEVPTDIKEEMQRVIGENDELRRACSELTVQIEQLRVREADNLSDKAELAAKQPQSVDRVSGSDGQHSPGDKMSNLDLDDLRTELEEERAKSAALAQGKASLQDDIKALRQETAERERQYVELEGKMHEMKNEYERRLGGMEGSAKELDALTQRFQERSEQLEQMRGLLEKQKALIVRSNQKSEGLQQKLRDCTEEWQQKEAQYRQKLQERDENFQRVLNQRLNEYAHEHRGEMEEYEAKIRKLKKKIKKMEGELDTCKEDFDRKVCECEELRKVVEEQKVEQMRIVRRMGQTQEEAQVYEKKEQIQNALERAKEEQRRKKDLFALGEVANVKRGEF